MTNNKSNTNKKPLYIFLIFLGTIGVIIVLLLLPLCTIEGISLVDKENIYDKYTGMYNVIGQRPEQYTEVYLFSNTFGSDDRIDRIRSYHLARLYYDIAVLKNRQLGINEVHEDLKRNRDKYDIKARDALQSIISDPSTIKLRTDSEGRFVRSVRPGRYFILIRSNRNSYDSSTEIAGELAYGDNVWLLPFQSYRYEQVWKSQSK
ncbi:MAG: hypothetical protein HY707_13575 [Ignavibacteriae bacterium]|nr:hypothetical protein [Ignavibacteriota bacterium]